MEGFVPIYAKGFYRKHRLRVCRKQTVPTLGGRIAAPDLGVGRVRLAPLDDTKAVASNALPVLS